LKSEPFRSKPRGQFPGPNPAPGDGTASDAIDLIVVSIVCPGAE